MSYKAKHPSPTHYEVLTPLRTRSKHFPYQFRESFLMDNMLFAMRFVLPSQMFPTNYAISLLYVKRPNRYMKRTDTPKRN